MFHERFRPFVALFKARKAQMFLQRPETFRPQERSGMVSNGVRSGTLDGLKRLQNREKKHHLSDNLSTLVNACLRFTYLII